MRPLAVGGPQRLRTAERAHLAELGYKSFRTHGMARPVPSGGAPPVAQKIANEVSNILRMPDVLAKPRRSRVIA